MAATEIGARVSELIRRKFGGSVNAAAKASRIPQPTLRLIAKGETAEPRGGALLRLAKLFDVDAEWLLYGTGRGPDAARQGQPGYDAWQEMMKAVGLDEIERIRFWEATIAPIVDVDAALMVTAGKLRPSESASWGDAFLALHKTWMAYLQRWIDALGAERVRDGLRHYLAPPVPSGRSGHAAVGELAGTIGELNAELERLKSALIDPEKIDTTVRKATSAKAKEPRKTKGGKKQ